MKKPIAVLIADIHFSLNTLQLADAALRQAIAKTNEFDVPIIVAGDLHDTKANMRAECVNSMLEAFNTANTAAYILRGNHDSVNERSIEHALNFLQRDYDPDAAIPGRHIVGKPGFYNDLGAFNGNSIYLIPYHHDVETLKAYLSKIDKNSLLIMHQGVEDSNMGDYVQDKSALPKECFKDFRVISGHYHARQDIQCGRPRKGAVGLFSYIGSPYTMSYGEANDPPKGFQVLYNDGLLEFVPTNLRKHIVYEIPFQMLDRYFADNRAPRPFANDLVWVKITGTKEQLATVDKKKLPFDIPFRLDLIPLETTTELVQNETITNPELLDSLIDSVSNTSEDKKKRLKALWKEL